MSSLFAIIELIFRLLKIWDSFSDYIISQRAIEQKKRAKERERAIDESMQAETEDEIWKSQEDIVRNRPRP